MVRWETLAVLKQDSLCWSRGRAGSRWCSTWSFFFFCFAFNLWVSIQAALLLYTAQLISKLSLNCCYSRKIISAELQANMRAAPYLKGLSWNWIVRNSRKLLKTVPFIGKAAHSKMGKTALDPLPHISGIILQISGHTFYTKRDNISESYVPTFRFRFFVLKIHIIFKMCATLPMMLCGPLLQNSKIRWWQDLFVNFLRTLKISWWQEWIQEIDLR